MNTTTDTTTAVLGDEALAVIAQFVEVKEVIKNLTKESDALKAAIAEALAGAKTGVTVDGEVAVRVSDRVRESVDLKTLKEAFPEAWQVAGRETSYEVYLTK